MSPDAPFWDIPQVIVKEIHDGRPTWSTTDLLRDFEVVGFAAPYVEVVRRSDGARGSLRFTHAPRFYYDWKGEI